MIKFSSKGDFSKITTLLVKTKEKSKVTNLEKFGEEGVSALKAATPMDTGLTSQSWSYTITRKRDSSVIEFHNSNIQNGIPIAVILQYGHGTKNGGYVQGRDYINPAIRPVFDKIANEAWNEVSRA